MKLLTFILLVFIAPALAGIFGAILDQINFTISPEFFRITRFPSMGLSSLHHERWLAALTGVINSWQFGIALGVMLSFIGTIHSDHKKMFKYTMQSFGIALGVTAVITFMGILITLNSEYEMPVNLSPQVKEPMRYMAVWNINNYAYAGGIIGMLAGAAWHIFKTKKEETEVEYQEHNG